MSIAEGYSISVQCDGTHRPGLAPRTEVYGYTKRLAHAELKKAGWRLGPNFTAYCGNCNPPGTAGVETVDGGQQREVTAREIYEGWRDQKGWVPWVEGGNSLMQDKARREAALGVNPTDGGKHD